MTLGEQALRQGAGGLTPTFAKMTGHDLAANDEYSFMNYVHGHHESVLQGHRWRTVENSAAYLVPELTAGVSVLDVGCGPGTVTAGLAEIVRPGRVIGIDQAALVVAEAVAQNPAGSNLSYGVADVFALPFEDDSFDVVHAHQVLQHVPDPVAMLLEMRRVCKPGGIVAARDADYGAMVWGPDSAELSKWRDLYRELARRSGGEPDAARHLLSWANACGFSDIGPSASVWCFATPPDRRYWAEQWADRVVSSRFADHARASGLASEEDLAGLARAWRRWASEDAGWFAVLHAEVICRV